MNTRKIFCYGLIAVIFVLAFAACKHEPDEPAHVHTWGNWQETTNPTCETAGVETRTCTVCGVADPQTQEGTPALGHDSGEWHTALEPGCATAGSRQLRCTRDNAVLNTDTVAALGHDWNANAETITTNATATETENSIRAVKCKRDSTHLKDEVIEYATGTAGLEYTLLTTGDYADTYKVSRGTFDGSEVFIPAYHRESTDDDYILVTSIDGIGGINSNNIITTLTTVTFAAENQLKIIGEWAFAGCTSLTSITIPNGVTSIGGFAFYNCTSLTSVTIPEGVTSIGSHAFAYCTSLNSITIPAGVTSIGERAFYDCPGLISVTFAVNSQLQTIGERAFIGCTGLASITIPAGVTSIGECAFSSCSSFTSITIPTNLTSIGQGAFSSCTSLTSITVEANNPNYTSEGGILYNKDKTTLIGYPSVTGSFTVPEGVTTIDGFAFYNCRLDSITIPEGVTSIGYAAFAESHSLASITIPTSVTTMGSNVFSVWSDGQTINVPFANDGAKPAGWDTNWKSSSSSYSNAMVKYWNGTTWE